MPGAVDDEIVIGVDENGLGPRLGPLIVTAIIARTSPAGRAVALGRARGKMRERLNDSKKLVGHGDTALGEAWARAVARRVGLPGDHGAHGSPADLVHALSLDEPGPLRALCPGDHAAQCWSADAEAFVAGDDLVAQVAGDLARLAARGVEVVHAACVVTCVRRINDVVARGLTRFHADLHAMERLLLAARARTGRDVVAVCGKVGGFDRYPPAFGPLSGWLHGVAVEGRARSEYNIPGLGQVAFVRDADERHLLVSMASLIGKWVRDLLMARIVRYHRAADPTLPDASGYHDPVTSRFVAATDVTRRKRELPDDCFERKALVPAAASAASAMNGLGSLPAPGGD
jgi:ribonuclease HII